MEGTRNQPTSGQAAQGEHRGDEATEGEKVIAAANTGDHRHRCSGRHQHARFEENVAAIAETRGPRVLDGRKQRGLDAEHRQHQRHEPEITREHDNHEQSQELDGFHDVESALQARALEELRTERWQQETREDEQRQGNRRVDDAAAARNGAPEHQIVDQRRESRDDGERR